MNRVIVFALGPMAVGVGALCYAALGPQFHVGVSDPIPTAFEPSLQIVDAVRSTEIGASVFQVEPVEIVVEKPKHRPAPPPEPMLELPNVFMCRDAWNESGAGGHYRICEWR